MSEAVVHASRTPFGNRPVSRGPTSGSNEVVDLRCQPRWPGEERGLSRRESEVLVLLSEGLTNDEIATALYVSRETVKSHVSTTIAKLGVRNRVQAATYAVRTATTDSSMADDRMAGSHR